jgi:hypothetical protein
MAITSRAEVERSEEFDGPGGEGRAKDAAQDAYRSYNKSQKVISWLLVGLCRSTARPITSLARAMIMVNRL